MIIKAPRPQSSLRVTLWRHRNDNAIYKGEWGRGYNCKKDHGGVFLELRPHSVTRSVLGG